ncbi:MAG TPA: NAD(P)-binding domain-containing protein [Thermoanaerobaculia bacterium]|nr:NAD(P)-binding domain-containing protein [Thermoanaerobaculia bacterium]
MNVPQPKKTSFDYIILGAGPASLQLAYFLQQAGRDYLVLEQGETPGSFFRKFPRHRTLISINKIHTGYDDPEIRLRWDWNSLLSEGGPLLKDYSENYFPAADDLVRYLDDFARTFDLNVRCHSQAVQISRKGTFQILDNHGTAWSANRLIVATGLSQPYLPPIPGIELAASYNEVSVNPKDFIGKRVLIIGKGNSGFETAENLIPTAASIHIASPHPVQFAWRTHFVGHLRAVNNNLLDTYQLKSQNASIDATIDGIERRDDGKLAVSFSYTHANGEREVLVYDHVIACTGFRFDTSIFDASCRPALVINERLPEQTSAWESANIPGLYFAGVLMQTRDYKKTTSAFIHGFRYNVRSLYRILEQRYHGVEWPHRPLAATPESLTAAVLDRVNVTSALWQQFGFLCDLILLADGGEARYLEELPMDFVRDSDWGTVRTWFTVTLEYGAEHLFQDPFAAERIARDDVSRAAQSNFLHPVVRRFDEGELTAEHHVIEDLAAEWREPEHIEPLLQFFREQLDPSSHGAPPGQARSMPAAVEARG